MNMTIAQALEFFPQKKIHDRLQIMIDVGLEYMTLGQPTSTLSGGEIQRLKLAEELHKAGKIYVLDEPSTGLHSHDIARLLKLLRNLIEGGNTVVIVEHRQEMIAAADWVIDMGPGGGKNGGQVMFTGTPQELINCEKSLTGIWLKKSCIA